MEIYYIGNNGEKIDFMSDDISAPHPEELFAYDWKYVSSSNIGNGEKIKRIYKEVSETDLTLEVLADNQNEFERLMNKMHDVFERDIYNLEEGKLYCNGLYKQCYIISQTYSNYDVLMDYTEVKLKVLSGYPYWIDEKTKRFGGAANSVLSDYGFDYAYDYSYDYSSSLLNQRIVVDGLIPSHFKMIIYGACENPAVSIGTHTYKVNTSLITGEYLTIDTLKKTITKVNNYGEETNVFDLRDRSYPNFFEKISAGASAVAWSGSYGFDVVLFRERSEPPWK